MLAIGIDLGNTNSVTAILRRGEPEAIPSRDGSPLTPSVLGADPGGRLCAGRAAEAHQDGGLVRAVRALWPGTALAAPVPLGEREHTPTELVALLLAWLREEAEAALGAPVRRATFAVPVACQQAQLAALRRAAGLAGLFLLQTVPSPVAGALAYALAHPQAPPQTVLAFDLGGGSLDVAVVRLLRGAVAVLGQAGAGWLGGDDLTGAIAASLLRRLQAERSLTLDESRPARDRLRQRLHRLAEQAKVALSTVEATTIPLTERTTGLPAALEERLLRTHFEELIQPQLAEAVATVERALVEAGLGSESLDAVLLLGGASQVPALEAALAGRFPDARLLRDLNPCLGAALGAAALAGMLAEVTCPACGRRNPLEAAVCRGCRAPLAGGERVPCPHCSLPNDLRRRACWRCGASLGWTARARTRPGRRTCPHCGRRVAWGRATCPAGHAAPDAAAPGSLRCTRCGQAVPAGTASCPTCGEPVTIFVGRVAGRSLGLERADGGLDIVLARGHPIPSPHPVYRELRTVGSGQRHLQVPIHEGDRALARDNPVALRLHLTLPAALPAGSVVRVGLALDASGLLAVSAELGDGARGEVGVRVESPS